MGQYRPGSLAMPFSSVRWFWPAVAGGLGTASALAVRWPWSGGLRRCPPRAGALPIQRFPVDAPDNDRARTSLGWLFHRSRSSPVAAIALLGAAGGLSCLSLVLVRLFWAGKPCRNYVLVHNVHAGNQNQGGV